MSGREGCEFMSMEREETREERRARIVERIRIGGRVITPEELPPLAAGEKSLWEAFQQIRASYGTFDDLEIPERVPLRDPPTFD